MAMPLVAGTGPVPVPPLGRPAVRLSYPMVDDCLGPAGQRYFGSGYRRVRYRVRDASFERDDRGDRLRGRAGVAHPVDWSSKHPDRTSRPHLTTVDGLLLGIRAAEYCTVRWHALGHRERCHAWPRRVEIRAGTSPVEDELDDFSLEARADAVQPAVDATRISCRVATMRARVEIVHAAPQPRRPPRFGPVADDLLGARFPGPYGRAYQDHHQTIRHLVVDLGTGRARARVRLGEVAPALSGPERADGRPVSMLDAFVVTMQLGQALLYESDGIRRQDSDTLWMRRVTITSPPPRPTSPEPLPATAALRDRELVQIRGHSWRTAVVEGGLGGVLVRCAVAHRLPASAAR